MDEIRLLSAVINMAAAIVKLATTVIEGRKRKKPFPPQSEKASHQQKE